MKHIQLGHSPLLSVMVLISLLAIILLAGNGCSVFKGKKQVEPAAQEKTAFVTAREEQDKLAEYTASAGRKDPKEKKTIHPGQTFLLSDKAKEIYRNTER